MLTVWAKSQVANGSQSWLEIDVPDKMIILVPQTGGGPAAYVVCSVYCVHVLARNAG